MVCELSADGSASADRLRDLSENFCGFEPDLDIHIGLRGGVLKIHPTIEILGETK